MADARNHFPPLFIIACALFGIGVVGLGSTLVLQPDSHILEGFLYIFIGCLAFGAGEILNHPKPRLLTIKDEHLYSAHFYRKRNPCSLGNLCDIGALILFFIGLSALVYPQ